MQFTLSLSLSLSFSLLLLSLSLSFRYRGRYLYRYGLLSLLLSFIRKLEIQLEQLLVKLNLTLK